MYSQFAQLVHLVTQIPPLAPYTASLFVHSGTADVVIFSMQPGDGDSVQLTEIEEFCEIHSDEDKLTAAITAIESILRGDYRKEVGELAG